MAQFLSEFEIETMFLSIEQIGKSLVAVKQAKTGILNDCRLWQKGYVLSQQRDIVHSIICYVR